MIDWRIENKKLHKDLYSLGLRDDKDGYWFIGQCEEWIMASYTNEVRIVEDLFLDGNGIYTGPLSPGNLNVYKDEKQIIKQVKSIIKKYKELQITKQLIKANEDFV